MKIISWNTNGLRATIKQGNFDPLFSRYKPDIICLQETKCEATQIDEKYLNYKDYYSYFSSSQKRKGYSGVCVYTKTKPEKVEYILGAKLKDLDKEGRTLILYFKDFILINCYFPNGGSGIDRLKFKLKFYDEFLKKCETLKKSGYKIIFCGDINTAHDKIDLARPKENEKNTGFLPIERKWIDKVIQNGYIDTFRYLYPNKKNMYTYWDQKTKSRYRNVGWRIDYFFISEDFVSQIKNSDMITNYRGSDHCPIFLEFKK